MKQYHRAWGKIGLAAFLLAGTVGCKQQGLPATPLFAGVEGSTFQQGSAMIQQRLDARFPKGSSARALAAYLEQQGLILVRPVGGALPTTGSAQAKVRGFVCGSQVRVDWKADKDQAVERIFALYGDTGCP